MSKKGYGPYSFGIISLILLTVSTPTFAEVTSLQTNSESYFQGDKIEFSGTVQEGSTGIVTIVIRDFNEQFVLLSQAIINPDYTFSKSVKIGEEFSYHGIHNSTGFILNMSKGVTNSFGVSLNGIPINLKENIESSEIEQDLIQSIDNEDLEKISIDFVDSTKNPKYYVDRYYNEPGYKSWFDRNYPGISIEEAVGYEETADEITSTVQEIIEKEIIPEAQASSIAISAESETNPETGQIVLAIAGLGILFGAVYGIKRKVDDNSKQISINTETIRRKIIHPLMGDNPKDILQTRLAKGEITIEEYEKLRLKLG